MRARARAHSLLLKLELWQNDRRREEPFLQLDINGVGWVSVCVCVFIFIVIISMTNTKLLGRKKSTRSKNKPTASEILWLTKHKANDMQAVEMRKLRKKNRFSLNDSKIPKGKYFFFH